MQWKRKIFRAPVLLDELLQRPSPVDLDHRLQDMRSKVQP